MSDTLQTSPRRNRFNSILVRVTGVLLVSGFVLSALMAWLNVRNSSDLIRSQILHAAREANEVLAVTASELVQVRAAARLEALFAPHFEDENHETLYAVAVHRDETVLAAAGGSPDLAPQLQALALRAIAENATVTSPDGMFVATPVVNAMTGMPAGAVATAWTAEIALAKNGRATVLNVLVAFGVVGIAVSAMVVLARRWIAVPVVRLSRIIDRLASEDYDVEVAYAARRDELGNIGRAVERLRDQLLAARQRARENRFRGTAFEASSAAVMMVDAELKITSINDSLREILVTHEEDFRQTTPGFDPQQVIGQDMDFFHAGGLKKRVRALLLDPANLPYRAEISVGDSRFRLLISRVDTGTGELDGFVVEWTDATSQFMNEAILASIAANQIQAEFALDGALLHGNTLLAEALGRDITALVGESGDRIFQFDEELAEINGRVFDQIARGKAVYGQFRLKRPDGRFAVVEGGFAPVTDSRGNLLRIILIGKDITEDLDRLARAEAERKALQAAQETVVDTLRVALERLAEGDLTARIETAFAADYDRLRTDFNEAAARLLTAMQGVIENAELIQGEASEISNAADDLSSRTERQAATLEQTASALDQLTASVRSSADGAAHASALVDSARKDAEASGNVVREAVEAMGEIENSSKQISKITGVIDDIAFQTNLLALNAGVEAARAGEAGRGFAVVASEVRALAQRSSDAAREINALISASDGQVKRGVDLVDQAGKALEGIVDRVQKISQNVSEIALSSQEQSSGLAEINTAMNQLDQVTQQNAAMFEQTTAASHALTREAQTLTQTMARFRTGQAVSPSATVVNPGFHSRRKVAPSSAPSTAPSTALSTAPSSTPSTAWTEPALAGVPAAATSPIDDGWDEF